MFNQYKSVLNASYLLQLREDGVTWRLVVFDNYGCKGSFFIAYLLVILQHFLLIILCIVLIIYMSFFSGVFIRWSCLLATPPLHGLSKSTDINLIALLVRGCLLSVDTIKY